MSNAELRSTILQLVNNISDKATLREIYLFLSTVASPKKQDWWEQLPQEVKESTFKSLNQYGNGDTVSHEDAMKKMSKKFPQLDFE